MPRIYETNCFRCGVPMELQRPKDTSKILSLTGKRKRTFCSNNCRDLTMSEESSQTMSKTNTIYASDRMKQNNPMKDLGSLERMRQTLLKIGHQPDQRGGNGQELPIPQQMLLEKLGESWYPEFVQRSNQYQRNNYNASRAYKIDIANPDWMVAIEVDGASHQMRDRQLQDKKKDLILNELGWTVLRFTNRQVMEHLEDCYQMVMSIILKLKEHTPILQTEF